MTPESSYPRGKTLNSGPRAMSNGQRDHLVTIEWRRNMEESVRKARENGTTPLEEFVGHWIENARWAKGRPPTRPRGRTLNSFGPTDEEITLNSAALAARLFQPQS